MRFCALPLTSSRVGLPARSFALTLAAVSAGVLMLVGGCKRDTVPVATPKEAATAFFKAMVAGDVAAAKAASVGDERSERWLEAVVENTAAMRAYHDAMKARFGEQPAGPTGLSDSAAGLKEGEVLAAVEKGETKIEGDNATITAADRRRVVHLKKVNGLWKVDRSQLGGEESVDKFVARTRRSAKAYGELAAEVRADKYKSHAEARQAFGERLVKAIEEIPPAGP